MTVNMLADGLDVAPRTPIQGARDAGTPERAAQRGSSEAQVGLQDVPWQVRMVHADEVQGALHLVAVRAVTP